MKPLHFFCVLFLLSIAWLEPTRTTAFAESSSENMPRAGGSSFPLFGENDFLEYWAAYQLYREDQDLYNPKLIQEIERREGWTEELPLMMWNPPWTMTLLSPLLRQDFHTAARTFLVLNVSLLLLGAALVAETLAVPRARRPLVIFASLCSVPVLFALMLGQLSVVIFFGVSGVLFSLERKADILAGFFLILLSLKFHVVYLFLLLLLLCLPKMRLMRISLSVAAFGSAILFIEFIQSPHSLEYWISRGRHAADPLLVDVFRWKTTTIATALRSAVERLSGYNPVWPVFAVPIATAVAFICWLWPRRKRAEWTIAGPSILPLSCATAPFSWIFDAAICIPTQLALYAYALDSRHSRKQRWLIFVLPLALQVTLLLQVLILHSGYEAYWYFAPALFLIWMFVRRRAV